MTLADAIRLALANNPRLAAFAKEVEAAGGRLTQAGLWPNPVLEAETEEGDPSRTAGFGGDNKIVGRLSQPLPISGRIGAQTAVGRRGQEVARLQHVLEGRQLVTAVRRAFFRILAAQRGVEVATTSRDIARDLRARADDRVKRGAAPETERLRADIELARAEVALERAETQLGVAHQAFVTLLGDVDLRVTRYEGTLPEAFPALDRERLEAVTLATYPGIVLAQESIEVARAQQQLAQVSWIPEPSLSVGAGRLREDREGEAILEWGISIPLPLFDRNQGRITETRALVRKSVKEYQTVLNETVLALRQALLRYEQGRAQVLKYREQILPAAQRALALIQDAYKEGKFTQIDVLDAQRTVAEARGTYLGLLEELISVAVGIEELAGKALTEFETK